MIIHSWIRHFHVGRRVVNNFRDIPIYDGLHRNTSTLTPGTAFFSRTVYSCVSEVQRGDIFVKSSVSFTPYRKPRFHSSDASNSNTYKAVQGTQRSSDSEGGYDDPTKHVNTVTDCFLVPYQRVHDEPVCSAPYDYTTLLPGKKSIPKYIDALQIWYHVPSATVGIIKKVAADMVNISLMLDDIQDGSELRRGLPAAHVIYGWSQTINSTTYALVKAVEYLERLKSENCRIIFFEESQNLCVGQGLDLYWRHHVRCPSIQEYIAMVDNKTGSFFRLASRLMEAEATKPSSSAKLLNLVTLMGRYYQIRDDYQNLASQEYAAKKGFCDDLSEGKFSLPLIHFLQHASPLTADRIHGVIFHRNQGTNLGKPLSIETKRWILSEMQRVGSLEYVHTVLNNMYDEMLTALAVVEGELGENKKIRIFLAALSL